VICLVSKDVHLTKGILFLEMIGFDQSLFSTLCTLVRQGTGVEKVNKAVFQINQGAITNTVGFNHTSLLNSQ